MSGVLNLDDTRDDSNQLRHYIANKNNLHIARDHVSLDAEFCNEAYETIKAFLIRLLFSNKEADEIEDGEITVEPVD